MSLSKQQKYDLHYLSMAVMSSAMSYCERAKVGAVIVTKDNIILEGWNGMPSGADNCCETEEGLTKDAVSHAEENAIMKAAKSTISTNGSTIYLTMNPCKHCSKMIYSSGISRVVYSDEYRDFSGVKYLMKRGISVESIPMEIVREFILRNLNNNK